MRIINTYTEYVDSDKFTDSEILNLCCEAVPVDPCAKVGRVSVYYGADAEHRDFDEVEALRAARSENPTKRIISVRTEGVGPPPGMPCGTLYESWEGSENCCDDVLPLSWDMDITPDVLPHGSSIVIAWEGSDGRQVEVRTTSNGTHFSDGRKTAIGHGSSIELFADETFCGATAVTVRDGCSEAAVLIRSDLGQWVSLGPICVLPGVENQGSDFSVSWSAISGSYRQLESVNWSQTVFMADNQPDCAELPGLCGDPGDTCLKLSAAADDTPCVGANGPYLGTGSIRCGRSGLSQRRNDPYANHGYIRFWTTGVSAQIWSC